MKQLAVRDSFDQALRRIIVQMIKSFYGWFTLTYEYRGVSTYYVTISLFHFLSLPCAVLVEFGKGQTVWP